MFSFSCICEASTVEMQRVLVFSVQVILAGTSNAQVLVLSQETGQLLTPPVLLTKRGQVSSIVLDEDGTALASLAAAPNPMNLAAPAGPETYALSLHETADAGGDFQLACKFQGKDVQSFNNPRRCLWRTLSLLLS